MGKLAKVLQGQAQPGLKAFKSGGTVKVLKEGSKKEEALDRKGMKCGGKAKK